jgi:diguanylate cyclase (GGDEF)-like protein
MTRDDTTQIRELKLMLPGVLIVDDDPLVAEHLTELVGSAGFNARSVTSGPAAIESLQEDFVPIVVLDRMMPEVDGLNVCQSIRSQHFAGYVYIILLTAHDSEEDVLTGLDAGADDYLSKRSSSAQLIARLRTAQRIIGLEQTLRTRLDEKSQQAMTDVLTGAHNRRYFMRHLSRELKLIQRVGGPLSFLMLDIDHFKRVNDEYGHGVGDEVLQEFTRRIGIGLPRECDWFARLGGEEFGVVLPQTSLSGARIVAERLRRQVSFSGMTTAVGPLTITVSIGVSGTQAVRKSEASVEGLLALADQYLYQSKAAGRDRVTVAEPVAPE